MKYLSTKAAVLAVACSVLFTGQSLAEETTEVKIARAMSAAPARISQNATIIDVDGTLLREGTNGWTCIPGVGLIPGDKHPMCNDAVWMAWMEAAQKGVPFTTDTIGYSYMLGGDAYVSNANPASTDPNDGTTWVQEGPHLMILLPGTAIGADHPDEPDVGPYTMWKNTGMVHIMVPVGERIK
ncbi:hypothetical protein GCM10017044_26520 [Kordiimonas sediminis]|uniref:Uncharacterized protein n=1 Tax=Kordiimonas sediminis TaxID=1735581 RepID=A0A919EAC9_9PROT|nr:hypothetical protein [Kordiimonas sediminis]GHF29909.1 hypothetical protein GCM10017044_26520 [Kordiimonas sediminis]